MTRRNILILIPLTILVLAAAAYFGIGYLIYDQLSSVQHGGGSNAGNTPSRFVSSDTSIDLSAYFMPQYEEVSIPSRQQGLNIAAWYIPAEASNAPVVIVVHGLNGCKCSPTVLLAAGMLHKAGFNVIALDLRDMGMSDIEDGRHAAGTEEHLDVLGVFDWLVSVKKFPTDKIGVWGASLGAGTSLDAFAAEPELAAVFADSPFSNMKSTLNEELDRNGYPTWLADTGLLLAKIVAGDDLMSITPMDAMRSHLGRPIFLTHGEADTRLDVHHSRDLLAAAEQNGADIETWFVPASEHTRAIWDHPAEYEQKLVAFFTRALNK